MRKHIENKIYHVEILPPKQDSDKLETDLERFATKYNRTLESGYCACITDNAMGLLAFQGTEVIKELNLPVKSEQIMIHLNTFHTKEVLDEILTDCKELGIYYLLIITGDGSDRLPKLLPPDVGAEGVESVTSVELLRYIEREYPGVFSLGVAFNPYEPEEHEFAKLDRKLKAGAEFIVTQPIIEKNSIVDKLLRRYNLPVIIEAWMSKKLHLLSEAVGYEIPEDTPFDPVETLKELHELYPECGVYLSLLGFKTQYPLLGETWVSDGKKRKSGLRMVVCVKQVPATHDAKIDPETKRIVREGLKAILNPFDTYAVEEAVQIKEKYGGEVIVVSMGPAKAENALREAVSVGADRAVLLNDRAFGGSDTWATSYALAKAIEKIGDVDLVICGKQAIDGDTAQVGPGIAAHLNWVQATYVMDIKDVRPISVTAVRMHEDGHDVCEVPFPAVISVVKDINIPRVPTLKGRRAANKIDIPIWKPDDIGADIEKLGLDGSPTRVVKTSPPPPREGTTLRIEGTAKECAKGLVRELRKRSLV